jgi:ADP-heptose:LPS heptosyltransferase
VKVAVIKLGALGDVVQALGPMQAIRAHHPGDHITLITTPPYADFLQASGLFDEVWAEGRVRGLGGFLRFAAKLRRARFSRVYDLQTSTRSSSYLLLLWPQRPQWSGVAFGASHPHANPSRARMHTVERQAEQLVIAGIGMTPPSDLGFAKPDLSRFNLPARYAVLVPGGSAHRTAKRWPAAHFGALANALVARGIAPVVIGQGAERALAEIVKIAAPDTIDLTDKTDFFEIAALGRNAALAVGNDTGPMHLLAAAGAPSLVLFSAESDPARCAPRGAKVRTLRVDDLAALPTEAVLAEIDALAI